MASQMNFAKWLFTSTVASLSQPLLVNEPVYAAKGYLFGEAKVCGKI